MSRARVVLLALAGLALPVALGLGVYAASAGSLAAVPAVVQAPAKIASPQTTPTETATSPTTNAGSDDDLPGKCRKPENALDPDCDPRTADDDDSGGGGSSGSDDDSSGEGSGGDDDSSGKGSGGDDDDSSGHGSGDDD